jgi:hypothetical protein
MTLFRAALWAEALKARRSKVPWLTALGFSLAPLVGGLFMIILKDPERARSIGLIGAKAQLAAGVADWPTLLGMLAQATAVGSALLFTLVTSWVFGREFSDTHGQGIARPANPPRGDCRCQIRGRGNLGCRTDGARTGAWARRRRSGRAAGMVDSAAVACRWRSLRHCRADPRTDGACSTACQRRPWLPSATWLGVPHAIPGADPGSYRMGGVVSMVGAGPI